jgi:hypothetical protein
MRFLQICLNLVHLDRAQTFIAAKTIPGLGEQGKTDISKSKREAQHSWPFATEQTNENGRNSDHSSRHLHQQTAEATFDNPPAACTAQLELSARSLPFIRHDTVLVLSD